MRLLDAWYLVDLGWSETVSLVLRNSATLEIGVWFVCRLWNFRFLMLVGNSGSGEKGFVIALLGLRLNLWWLLEARFRHRNRVGVGLVNLRVCYVDLTEGLYLHSEFGGVGYGFKEQESLLQ